MEAIVADHVGTQKCAWSTAEMKVNFFQIFFFNFNFNSNPV